jgi:hypothetical protein
MQYNQQPNKDNILQTIGDKVKLASFFQNKVFLDAKILTSFDLSFRNEL